jgi:hypothetical protein
MHLRVTLHRSDIARGNLLLLLKSPSCLKSLAIFVLAVGALVFWSRSPDSPLNWFVLAVSALIGGLFAFLANWCFSLAWILSKSTVKAGVIGEHCFEITERGFREKTEQNEAMQGWSSMLKPLRSRQLILVRPNSYLFYVLPRRAFEDDHEYEEWWSQLSRRCGAA